MLKDMRDEAFDDPCSVMVRDKKERAAFNSKQNAKKALNLPAQSIPFTIDELRAMLTTLENAQAS